MPSVLFGSSSYGVPSATIGGVAYRPAPTLAVTPPVVPMTPAAESTATGIEPQQLEAILYGKDIPVFVGGKMRIGGRIIEGPFFGGTSTDPTVSYIASHAVCAAPGGARTITEFSLRGRVAWTLADGPLLDGLDVEFRDGTEDQLPFDISIDRYDVSAVAYRGHILSRVKDLPLSTFAGVVPFPSVFVEDSTFGDPDDGITRVDALETILRYARLDDDEFEVDVTGADDAVIIGQKVELVPFLQSLRNIFVNWNITITDKLRIIEPAEFAVDAVISRGNHIARSMRLIRAEPLTKPREKIYRFIDPARDYEPNAATARQELYPAPTTSSIESETIELPLVTSASQAMADVNYALFQQEVARKQLAFTGMASLVGLEPGDGISFSDHAHFRFRGRITELVRNAADFTTDVTAETWLNCEGAVDPEAEHVTCVNAEQISATTMTFGSVDFGVASAARVMVVAVNVRLTSSEDESTITSVVIGGVEATIAVQHTFTGGGGAAALVNAICYAAVPNGATGAVQIVCNGTFQQATAHVYRVITSSFVVHDTASNQDDSFTAVEIEIDVPADGVVIAAAMTRQGASITWSGATQDCEFSQDTETTGMRASATFESVAGESAHAISVDPDGFDFTIISAISFSP